MTRNAKLMLPGLALAALAWTVASHSAAAAPAGPGTVIAGEAQPALQPPTTGGVAAVDRALARLSVHKRLLVIGAHPDDEDTSLLTLVARGMGGEAAYLSLSRGEGGQNLIGPELGVGLGIIRSRELLAARAIDGGRQFFTRAYDFGYTRSLDETLSLWPKETLLADATRVIRRFRPQVVVSVFPPTAQAGHGQHQAAGTIAPLAFAAAGDPAAVPELADEGLASWQPKTFYRSAWFDRDAASVHLPIGGIDPQTGKSIYQLAMASRSQHRSQDMGRLQELGGQETRVAWVSGGAGVEGKDLWSGVDTRLSAIAEPLGDAPARREVESQLAAAGDLAIAARAGLAAGRPEAAVAPLLKILGRLRAARTLVAGNSDPERAVAGLIDEKIAIAEAGAAAAAGIAVDASIGREGLIGGESFEVAAVLWNSGGATVAKPTLSLLPAPEWGGEATAPAGPTPPGAADKPAPGSRRETPADGRLLAWKLTATVPPAAPPTVPYFLRRPLQGALYDWSAATPTERGEPFGPAPLTARFSFVLDGVPLSLDREVVHLHGDQALGEVRRPLRVDPVVEVDVAEHLLAWPVARRDARRLSVTLTSHAEEAVEGKLTATAPAGWKPVAPLPFRLELGEEKTVELALAAAPGLAAGSYPIDLVATLPDGRTSGLAAPVIGYPHLRPTPYPEPATVRVSAIDLTLPPLKRVGYVRGASDRVPEYLRQVGVPIEMLGPAELANADLSGLDAIVVGSRAYETDPALGKANHRLLDYARNGGLVIVQYQQYPFIEGKFAPLPLEIARPHDRITDETAAVRLLDPASPVFTTPNRIGAADWQGWIQERGLYFAHTWDPGYTPLLAMADPGGPELQGGLLVARLGKGTYVYTGLALFRELPAGVPGAYRLFANLLALADARKAK